MPMIGRNDTYRCPAVHGHVIEYKHNAGSPTRVYCVLLLVMIVGLGGESLEAQDYPLPEPKPEEPAALLPAPIPSGDSDDDVPVPIPEAQSKYADAIEAHMEYLTEHSLDRIGDESTPMWLATIDLRTNGVPDPKFPKWNRWSRDVVSAGGCNLYLDQPMLVAAYELSKRTGCACYEDSADAYIKAYFEKGREDYGISWGPNRYYDAASDRLAKVEQGEIPIGPWVPAWEQLWRLNDELTTKVIGGLSERAPMRSVTSRAIEIESYGWFTRNQSNNDPRYQRRAMQLVESFVSEDYDAQGIGIVVSALCRTSQYMEQESYRATAEEMLTHWLSQNEVRISLFQSEAKDRATGLELGEACLVMFDDTGKNEYREVVDTMRDQIKDSMSRCDEGYAEEFGRAIHFLLHAESITGEAEFRELAIEVADEAMRVLYVPKMGMFRSHPNENRCDAVDGPGFLLLALLRIDGELSESALHF